MEFKELRYYFEHKVLYDYLERKPGAFIMGVLNEKEIILNNAFKNFCEENECEYIFTEENFKVDFFKFDEEYLAIKIDMPTPTCAPECYNIFITFNEDMSKIRYFTLEYNDIVNSYFLCSWHDQKHFNYGKIEDINSKEEILTKIYLILTK